MIGLEVVEVGVGTSLQDGGRLGQARFGVPRSGPVDVLSHRLAARLAGVVAGQVSDAVAIEVGPRPCLVRPVGGAVTLALAGVGATLDVDGATVPAPCVVGVETGQRVTVHARTWAYLVPTGDVEVPPLLGSASTHPRSGLGPTLEVGTVLTVGPARPVTVGRRRPPTPPVGPYAVLPAPQTERFTAEARRALVEEPFRTTTELDRMGQRLAGPLLPATGGHDIVSDAIVAGTVQVPGDGIPYVLTADHQTTGGYPKIAVLSVAALARLVQQPPGTTIRFAWTDVATARAALRAAHAAIEQVVAGPARPTEVALRRANLIGGVTDGA